MKHKRAITEPLSLEQYGEHLQRQLYSHCDCDPNQLIEGFTIPVKVWTEDKIASLERLVGIGKEEKAR